MERLQKEPTPELVRRYDWLTARAKRTEVSIGLAYAVLVALLYRAVNLNAPPIDCTRLDWGEAIRTHLSRTLASTASIALSGARAATVTVSGAEPRPTIVKPDGTPHVWTE
jgi:hypothetical protein